MLGKKNGLKSKRKSKRILHITIKLRGKRSYRNKMCRQKNKLESLFYPKVIFATSSSENTSSVKFIKIIYEQLLRTKVLCAALLYLKFGFVFYEIMISSKNIIGIKC